MTSISKQFTVTRETLTTVARAERAVEGGLMSQRVFQNLPLFCFGLFCYTNHLMTRNQSLSVNYSICYPVIISLELK